MWESDQCLPRRENIQTALPIRRKYRHIISQNSCLYGILMPYLMVRGHWTQTGLSIHQILLLDSNQDSELGGKWMNQIKGVSPITNRKVLLLNIHEKWYIKNKNKWKVFYLLWMRQCTFNIMRPTIAIYVSSQHKTKIQKTNKYR